MVEKDAGFTILGRWKGLKSWLLNTCPPQLDLGLRMTANSHSSPFKLSLSIGDGTTSRAKFPDVLSAASFLLNF